MANPSKDNASSRVQAPPGGPSNNIFSTSEFEQSAANKKKQSGSDIFGYAKEQNVEPAPAKPARSTGNNTFGSDHQESGPSAGTLAGQYKQSQMKSSIFGSDEPTSTRAVSDKNKSNIFGPEDPTKRQAAAGGRRDPNASRMGYNPINGESYGGNGKPNENEKSAEPAAKSSEEPNGNAQAGTATESENTHAAPAENGNAQVLAAGQTSAQVPQANTTETNNGQKVDNAQKNVHTSVRVFHPPGGRSNGPLW